jgi:hypothetical protein
MAAIPSVITELLGKGAQLTRDDLLEIRTAIYEIDAPARFDVARDVAEGVSLIVLDPEYLGDITLADLDEPADDELDRLGQ